MAPGMVSGLWMRTTPTPLMPGSQELSVLRASAEYTSDSYESVSYPSLRRGRNKFWARAHLEARHWVHSLICLWFSEVPESAYWDCPKGIPLRKTNRCKLCCTGYVTVLVINVVKCDIFHLSSFLLFIFVLCSAR